MKFLFLMIVVIWMLLAMVYSYANSIQEVDYYQCDPSDLMVYEGELGLLNLGSDDCRPYPAFLGGRQVGMREFAVVNTPTN